MTAISTHAQFEVRPLYEVFRDGPMNSGRNKTTDDFRCFSLTAMSDPGNEYRPRTGSDRPFSAREQRLLSGHLEPQALHRTTAQARCRPSDVRGVDRAGCRLERERGLSGLGDRPADPA
jgi:hypothetical protein